MNRYLGALFLGVCLSSTAIAGCGDDSSEDDGGDGGGQKAELNQASAASTAKLSAGAVSALNAGDGPTAAGSLFGVAGTALTMALPGQGGSQTQSLTGELGRAASAECDTACEGDADSGTCTFTGCDTGSFTVEGSLTWGGGHFDCDLNYGIAASSEGQNIEINYHLTADIDYTETSIDGTLSMDGDSSAGGQSSSFDVDIVYNELQFPADGGCPTSGSMSVTASIDAGGASYDASGEVTFPSADCF